MQIRVGSPCRMLDAGLAAVGPPVRGGLGIGERRAAVPIEQIQFGALRKRARLNMSREQLEQFGNFDRNNLGQHGIRYG